MQFLKVENEVYILEYQSYLSQHVDLTLTLLSAFLPLLCLSAVFASVTSHGCDSLVYL